MKPINEIILDYDGLTNDGAQEGNIFKPLINTACSCSFGCGWSDWGGVGKP